MAPGLAVHDGLCAITDEDGRIWQEFTSDRPNERWLTDITEHRTAEGKLYLCAIKDAFSNKIVGHPTGSRRKFCIPVRALEDALAMRDDTAGRMVHSDR